MLLPGVWLRRNFLEQIQAKWFVLVRFGAIWYWPGGDPVGGKKRERDKTGGTKKPRDCGACLGPACV